MRKLTKQDQKMYNEFVVQMIQNYPESVMTIGDLKF